MTHAIASPRLAGIFSALCGFAMLPFVWLHLLGAKPEGLSVIDAARLQLQADMALPTPERWLVTVWLLLPVAWAVFAVAYLQKGAATAARGTAQILAIVSLLPAGLSTSCYGIATAPLFLSVPFLAFQAALRVHPNR